MGVCPTCGRSNPEGFRFCPDCATPLSETSAHAERKTVSVLFCDLVGFTAASEYADPEDVRSRLLPYYRLARERIEGFGGHVEKFVGDAVMGVFGAPVAHEDDPERAIRAGLRILESLAELNAAGADLHVRIGVNTGEVLVSEVATRDGEGSVTGDAVNTASRIQAAAPVDSVVVGASAYDATKDVFTYEPLSPQTVKGKSEPLMLWRAQSPRGRHGADLVRSMASPLYGRDLEMTQLGTLFERSMRDRVVQLVTIVGEPGIGKSRLVLEFGRYLDQRPDLVVWRQGRCLPYGDGITYWALGEIVKAHADVLEGDAPDDVVRKLDRTLPPDERAEWLRARLLPLLGVDTGAVPTREELFSALRQYVEGFAERVPAVIVVEDIHWADEAMLAFLEYLTEWVVGLPLIVVCTARLEFLEARPSWGSRSRNSASITLNRLSDSDTASIVSALAEDVSTETAHLIVERAAGNPLYAEEFVRVVRDRAATTVEFPAGLNALIAARLDTLPVEHKSLLSAAAVVGQVFWSGSLPAVVQTDVDVTRALHELTRKEFVRRSRTSTMAGEDEYAFSHALVRDVAYAALPRPSRAAKHLAAAQWLENKAADRIEDVAEVLAHHAGEALELASAARDEELVARAHPAALRYTLLAVDRVAELDAASTLRLLEQALALVEPTDGRHPELLCRWAEAARQVDRLREAADAYERAADEYLNARRVVDAARAFAALASTRFYLGDPGHTSAANRAAELIGEVSPSPDAVPALSELAAAAMLRSAYREAIDFADRAIEQAERTNTTLPGRALFSRGSARAALGDRSGLDDLAKAIDIQRESRAGHGVAAGYNNLGIAEWMFHGPQAALAVWAEGLLFAEERGLRSAARHITASSLQPLIETGQLDVALERAESLRVELEETGHMLSNEALAASAWVRIERADRTGAELAEQALSAPRPAGDPAYLVIAVAVAALGRLLLDDHEGTSKVLGELDDCAGLDECEEFAPRLPTLVRCALAVGRDDLAERLIHVVHPTVPLREHALLAAQALRTEAAGHHRAARELFAEVARRWHDFGNQMEEAHALLGAARCATGSDARPDLQYARDLFVEMQADLRIAHCDELLAR